MAAATRRTSVGWGFPEPDQLIASAITFILAISVHEFMHAWSAKMLGDNTAEREGRVTLNPIAHFDPIGFLFGLLLIFGIAPIAWGKPVPVNPYRLRGGRRGMALVAVAGPLSNLAMAVFIPVVLILLEQALRANGVDQTSLRFLSTLVSTMILWNIALFAFNLIPIPPLDGFNILVGLAPSYWIPKLEMLRQYSMIILLLVIFIPLPGGGSLLSAILVPVQRAVLNGLVVPLIQVMTGGGG
jgi:Zn-dependent protease